MQVFFKKFKIPIRFGVFLFLLTLAHLTASAVFKKDRLKIGDFVLHPEEVGAGSGVISPFETDLGIYSSILKNRAGALITTGSALRIYDLLGSQISTVFVLNSDSELTQFNLACFSLIGALRDTELTVAGQRFQFAASILLRRLLTDGELSTVLGGDPQEKDRRRLERLSALPDLPSNQAGAVSAVRASVTHRIKDAIHEIAQILAERDKNPEDPNGLSHQLREFFLGYLGKEPAERSVFWASDEGWIRIREMLAAGKVFAVNGTFSGKTLLRSIGTGLRSRKETVGVIDFSNLPQSLLMLEPKVDNPELRRLLIANLDFLPCVSETRFLFNLPSLSFGVDPSLVSAGAVAPPSSSRTYFALGRRQFFEFASIGAEFRSFLFRVVGESGGRMGGLVESRDGG